MHNIKSDIGHRLPSFLLESNDNATTGNDMMTEEEMGLIYDNNNNSQSAHTYNLTLIGTI